MDPFADEDTVCHFNPFLCSALHDPFCRVFARQFYRARPETVLQSSPARKSETRIWVPTPPPGSYSAEGHEPLARAAGVETKPLPVT